MLLHDYLIHPSVQVAPATLAVDKKAPCAFTLERELGDGAAPLLDRLAGNGLRHFEAANTEIRAAGLTAKLG